MHLEKKIVDITLININFKQKKVRHATKYGMQNLKHKFSFFYKSCKNICKLDILLKNF